MIRRAEPDLDCGPLVKLGPMSRITVAPLSADHLHTVYPLIREVAPGLDLAGWLRLARRMVGPRRAGRTGIMVALRDGRTYPCGLFFYRRELELTGGAVLIADHFVALDILDAKPVLAALVGELEALARRLECGSVQSTVRTGAQEVAALLSGAGHQREGETLRKRIGAPPAAGTEYEKGA